MQMRINNPNHQPNQESANTIVLECTTVRHQDSVVSVPGELLSATEERCWDVPNPSCIIQWNTCCEAGISIPTLGEKPHHANSDFTQVQAGPLLEASQLQAEPSATVTASSHICRAFSLRDSPILATSWD